MHRSVRGAHRRGELLRWRRLLGRDGPVGVALRINESGVGQGVGRQTHGAECKALTAGAGSSTGNSLVETFQSASPYTHRTRDGVREWVGRRRRAQIARRTPPGRAPPPETP